MTSLGSVVVLYNQLPGNASKDDLDVLCQVDAVSDTLDQLGFRVSNLAFSINNDDFTETILGIKPSFVFNLVESVLSKGRLSYLAPALLERLGIKYTGCSAESILLTTDKVATKKILKHLGISTPPWVSTTESDGFIPNDTYIVKALSEDASIGICNDSVMPFNSIAQAQSLLNDMKMKFKRTFFAEKYIDGREFSISILGDLGEPRILAPSEIRFIGYDEINKPKVVDYKAKWETDSFEYKNTFSAHCQNHEDHALMGELRAISVKCWENFKLRGYARIDFRVDNEGKPWVLEINANPCITPGESGFLKSAKESGFDFNAVIQNIITEALYLRQAREPS